MSQELKRVMYESILWNEPLMRRLMLDYIAGGCTDEIRYAKSVSSPSPSTLPLTNVAHRFFLGCPERREPWNCLPFPNMHVTIRQELNPQKAYPEETIPPRHTAELMILRTTSLAIVTSLLSYPLDWAFADGQTIRSPVLGVATAYVHEPAIFIVGEVPANGLFTPTSAGLQCTHVAKCTPNGTSEQLAISVRTLAQFSSRDTTRAPGRNRVDIQCDVPEDVEAWLIAVSIREQERMILA
jgi:hypothetical protein